MANAAVEQGKWSPLRAIRNKCLDCCCQQTILIRECHIKTCTLWPFRMGKNPNRKGVGGRNLPVKESEA